MRTAAICMAVAAVLTGCSKTKTGLVVAEKPSRLTPPIADITFAAPDGTTMSWNHVRKEITIVAFTANPPGECYKPNPVLKALADSFRYVYLPVAVVQISRPTGPEAMKVGAPPSTGESTRLIRLCDPTGAAWFSFGHPRPGDVLLIDWNNQIVQTGTLDNLGYVPALAESLGQQVRWEYYGEDDTY